MAVKKMSHTVQACLKRHSLYQKHAKIVSAACLADGVIINAQNMRSCRVVLAACLRALGDLIDSARSHI